MTVNRTTLLDLPLPVTGTESGTWGDTTNNGLTQYLDIAIAGTLVLSTDADVTLTSTEGDSSATNIGATTAQYAILRWTATGSTTRNITALAQSKTYVVINATGGTQSIVLRGAGPTTGVTIISGEKAHCVWNGSDFVKVSSSAAAGGSNTQVQYNSSGVLAGSSNLTFDGTSLTLGGNPTLSAGTANGVLYLNGSKVATSGSALTFDGSKLGIGASPVTPLFVKATSGGTDPAVITGERVRIQSNDTTGRSTYLSLIAGTGAYSGVLFGDQDAADVGLIRYLHTDNSMIFNISASEAMRLTSTGLGIGTSSPSARLEVFDTSAAAATSLVQLTGQNNYELNIQSVTTTNSTVGARYNFAINSSNGEFSWSNSGGERMRLDSSGNLGLGVTPSGWNSIYKVLQVGVASLSSSSSYNNATIGANLFYNASNSPRYINSDYATLYVQDDGIHVWYTAPSGTAGNAITFTQAMTLDASGNLAIKNTTAASFTQNASTDLVVGTGSASAGITIYTGTANQGAISFADGTAASDVQYRGFINYSHSIDALILGAAGSERARITSGGFFKASNDGTYVNSTGAFHELRSDTADAYTVRITQSNATPLAACPALLSFTGSAPNDTTAWFLDCTDNTARRAYIRSNGGLSNYQSNNTDLSDIRTKRDISAVASMWSKIGALEIVNFKYKDQTHDDINVGVIAQQVESVEPLWVDADGWGDETPEDGVPLKTVYTKDITFAAIKALQEAMTRIEQLEAKVSALEGTQP